jgi:hypothetical protein
MLPVERLLEEIRAFVAHKVAEGFDSGEQIIDQTLALFVSGEAYNPSYFSFSTQEEGKSYREQELRPQVERITAELLEERRRLESAWAEPTDCDKLDWAFEELNRCGIVARQNLPCCITCGKAEEPLGASFLGGRRTDAATVSRFCSPFDCLDTGPSGGGRLGPGSLKNPELRADSQPVTWQSEVIMPRLLEMVLIVFMSSAVATVVLCAWFGY